MSISLITWFEAMEGVFQAGIPSSQLKRDTARANRLLSEFVVIEISSPIGRYAMEMYLAKKAAFQRLSVGHCFVAATSLQLGIPLYSRNSKHMNPLVGDNLIVPYTL